MLRPESKAQVSQESQSGQSKNNKFVLFSTYVYHDGLGDHGNLLDLIRSDKLPSLLPAKDSFGNSIQYQPIIMVICNDATPDRLRYIINSQQEAGTIKGDKNPYDLNDDQLSHYINTLMENNSFFYLCTNDKSERLVKNLNQVEAMSRFQDQLKNCCGGFQVSFGSGFTDHFTYSTHSSCMISFLGEQVGSYHGNSFSCSMGIGKQSPGVFLERYQFNTLEKKAVALQSIKNKEYLERLLETKELTTQNTSKFLQTNLFIPGYLQYVNSNAVFVLSIAAADITKKYQNLVFHLNSKKFDPDLLVRPLLRDHGFYVIEICDRETSKNKIIKIANPIGNRRLRIMTGFNLNDTDYNLLYASAQMFGGCSGDQTFQKVLSYRLIPFHHERHYKAVLNQLKELKSTEKTTSTYVTKLKELEGLGARDIPRLTQELSNEMKEGFAESWKKMLEEIHEHHNIYDKLPNLFNITFQVHDLYLAVTQDNLDVAKKILEQLSSNDASCVLRWASRKDFHKLAAYIFTHFPDKVSSNLNQDEKNAFYYLGCKYGFVPAADPLQIEKENKKIQEIFINSIKKIIQNDASNKSDFYSQLNEVLESKDENLSNTFIKIATILINHINKKEAEELIYSLVSQITESSTLLIYLNIPKNHANLSRVDFILGNIPEGFHDFLNILKSKLQEKISELKSEKSEEKKSSLVGFFNEKQDMKLEDTTKKRNSYEERDQGLPESVKKSKSSHKYTCFL